MTVISHRRPDALQNAGIQYVYSARLIKTRSDKKHFGWWHKDDAGSWHSGAGGYEIPLYHQDDLNQRPDASVLIFEGEKDCDNARGCPGLNGQYVILCLPFGATGRLKPHQGEALKDRDVLICYDLDEAGQRGAEQLASDLAGQYNCPVRILQPQVETGKDFSDWVQAYGDDAAAALVLAAIKPHLRRIVPKSKPPVKTVEKSPEGLYTAICDLGMDFRFNERASRMEIFQDGLWLAFNDRYQQKLRRLLEEQFQYHTQRHLKPLTWGEVGWWRAIQVLAHDHAIDPFKEWLEQLTAWDGKARLDLLLHSCFQADPDDEVVRWSSRYICGAAVTRTYQPGYKFDTLPILIGPQGCGKSTFLRELLPPHLQPTGFSDTLRLDGSRKEQVEAILGAILCEVPEMTGASRANIDLLKRFLSAQNDYGIRLAYRRNPEDLPRRCILLGTTNHQDCIPSDPTGYRRFVPIQTLKGPLADMRT